MIGMTDIGLMSFLVVGLFGIGPGSTNLKEGDKAPEFALPSQDGKMIRLTDFRGRTVILYFYPKDDTPGCTKEACSFRDDVSRFKELKTEILGVSVDDVKSHKEFQRKYNLNFTLLADVDKEVTKLYGVKNLFGLADRVTFIIDKDGVIRKIFPHVDVSHHSEELLEFVRQLEGKDEVAKSDTRTTPKTTVSTKAKVGEKPLEFSFPPGTNAIYVGSLGGIVTVDSLQKLGVTKFDGNEKDKTIKTTDEGWMHIITNPTWPGLIFVTEPSETNKPSLDVQRTKDRSIPNGEGSSSLGNITAVPTNRGVIIRINGADYVNYGYASVIKELGVETLQNPQTQIHADQNTGEIKIICTASNSSRKAEINLGTGEVRRKTHG